MKKTLLAATILGAFACAASAANVQVYGLIDTSLSFVHSDADISGVDSKNSFTMENAEQFGSRFGLRGSEDLGNGMKVSFVLESGFESDTGALDTKQRGRLFGRESNVTVSGGFGDVTFGLIPIFGSVLGANGLFRALDPVTANYTVGFGSGFATASSMTRVDNAISYKTPTFAGFTGYAMYSFKVNGKDGAGQEGDGSTDRYASLAVRYQQGPLEAVLIADQTRYGNDQYRGLDDGSTVTFGGNYTLDNGLKLIAFGQWFDSMILSTVARAGVAYDGITELLGDAGYGQVDGYGLSFGVNFPLAGGVAKASVNYRDMDNTDNVDFTRWTVAGGYDYPLSKRTTVYAMGGYSQEKVELNDAKNTEATPGGYQLVLGLLHRF
ncbi:MAG: porin [Sutterella parvirubra]|nr:porin [Sutterella parvirubra]